MSLLLFLMVIIFLQTFLATLSVSLVLFKAATSQVAGLDMSRNIIIRAQLYMMIVNRDAKGKECHYKSA